METRCERCQEVLSLPAEVASLGGEVACPSCGNRQVVPSGGGGSLEDELGAAFDTMLQPGQASAPAEAADPNATEWYVAIEGQQVGPVSFADLQERWARGVIGPDSLCWRAGLDDWVPIASLPELMEALPPAPPIPSKEIAPEPSSEAPAAEAGSEKAARKAEAEEPEWKPSAASALESLVEREMEEAEKRQEEQANDPTIPDPETTGIRVVLRDLPEPPPPEPSKFIPIPKNVPEPAPAPIARPQRPVKKADEAPKKESRMGLVALAAAVLVVGGGALAYFGGFLPGGQAPAPAETPATPAVAEAPPPVAPPAAAEKDEKKEEAEEAEKKAEASDAEEKSEEKTEVAEAESPGEQEATTKVAEAPPAPSKAQPAPAASKPAAPAAPRKAARPASKNDRSAPATKPAPRRSSPPPSRSSSGSLLAAGNSSSIDNLFEEKPAPKPAPQRSDSQPYIPPPPGSGVQRPQKLGQGEIMSVVASHRSALRNCASSYKEQGGGSGSVVMSWVIEPDGRTSSIRAAKGREHAGMVRCLENLIKDWRFPSYSGPKMEPIEFPFQF